MGKWKNFKSKLTSSKWRWAILALFCVLAIGLIGFGAILLLGNKDNDTGTLIASIVLIVVGATYLICGILCRILKSEKAVATLFIVMMVLAIPIFIIGAIFAAIIHIADENRKRRRDKSRGWI